MPGYKGHLAGGCASFFIIFLIAPLPYQSFTTSIEWFCFSLLGSLFPDVDTKSKGQKLFYRSLVVLLLLLVIQAKWSSVAGLCALAILPQLCRHRGMFHSPLFLLAFPLSITGISLLQWPHYGSIMLWDSIFFIVGAFSHIFLDRGFRAFKR